jgi:hypothetical protein
MATEKRQVIDGPSKYDLMVALFNEVNDVKRRHKVVFTTTAAEGSPVTFKLTAVIEGVMREDGTGESWCINGYTVPSHPSVRVQTFTGHFSTQSRQGHLHFTDDSETAES